VAEGDLSFADHGSMSALAIMHSLITEIREALIAEVKRISGIRICGLIGWRPSLFLGTYA